MLYSELLASDDYITKRQALRLLGEILRDEEFMLIRSIYVSDEKFLRIHMNLLLDNSKMVQHDAFRVFKIFVLHSEKSLRVQRILMKNKDKLVQFLESLDMED